MPKYHSKLHDINSPIDHYKFNGLYDLEKGLGLVTDAPNLFASVEFFAEPFAATDPVLSFYDRTVVVPTIANTLLSVNGEGKVSFVHSVALNPAVPAVPHDIEGMYDPTVNAPHGLPDNKWWIDRDGNASFQGDVSIYGSLLGPAVIDTLDELLTPTIPSPDRNKAFQRNMLIFDDAAPGTNNAFSVDTGIPKAVTVGYAGFDYSLNVKGVIDVVRTTFGTAAISITNPSGDDVASTAVGGWHVSHLGLGTFNGLVSSPPVATGGVVVNMPGGGAVDGILVNHNGSGSAVAISNVGTGHDVTGTGSTWYVRADGSSYFSSNTTSIGVAIVSSGSGNSLDIQNGGSGAAINANQTGATANVVVLSSLGTVGAELVVDGNFTLDPTGTWNGFDGVNWQWDNTLGSEKAQHITGTAPIDEPIGALVAGTPYLVSFQLIGVTSGVGDSVTPSLGGTAGTSVSFTGSYSEVIIPAVSAGSIVLTPTSGFLGYVDNVSVKQLTGGAANAIIDITNTSSNYDVEGNAGNWYAKPNGLIHSNDVVQAVVAVETPILRNGGALLVETILAGNITARTTVNGDFVFDMTSTLPAGKVVRPANDADTDLGTLGFAWKRIYGGSLYVPYLYNVREVEGDGVNPLRLDSNTKALEIETQGGGINVIDSGLTLNGNSLTLDNILLIGHVSGSDLTIDVSKSAHDLVLQAQAAHGLLPSVDNTLNIGSYAKRFGNLYATNLKAVASVDSAVSGVYANMSITSGAAALDATSLALQSGNLGISVTTFASAPVFPTSAGIDLGKTAAANRWNDIYMDGTVNGPTTISGNTGTTLEVTSTNGHNLFLDSSSNLIDVHGSMIPDVHGVYDLGSITYATPPTVRGWRVLYVGSVVGTSPLNVEAQSGNLTLRTTTSGDVNITSVNAVGITSTGATRDVTVNAGRDFVVNTGRNGVFNIGGSAVNFTFTGPTPAINFGGATLSNCTVNIFDYANSFTFNGSQIVTGLKQQVVTLDSAQSIAETVTLKFGSTNNKSLIHNPAVGQGFHFDDSLTVDGNLTINGTLSYVNTDNLNIKDRVITVNYGDPGPGITDPSKLGGMEVNRGSSTNATIGFDEVKGLWVCGIGTVRTDLHTIVMTDFDQTVTNKLLTLGKNGATTPFAGVLTLCDGLNPGSTVTLSYAKWQPFDALGTGIVVKTAATPTYSPRSIATNGAGWTAVANADGVSGNPTLELSTALKSAAGLAWASGTPFVKMTAADTFALDTNTYSLSSHNHAGVYEPVITAGTTSQYWRGDKSWQTLDKSAVGLSNVQNLDQTNASNISSGTVGITYLPTGTTGTTVALGNHLHTGVYAPVAHNHAGTDITSGLVGVTYGGTGVNASAAANGTLLIGNGTGYTLATLTQGSNMSITNAAGSITVAVGANVTVQGNSFNGASQLVQMTAATKLPAVDGSLLTSMTSSQVGLGNVTNDAQLKRSANDFNSFTLKGTPTTSDILLIEDAGAAGVKKYITIGTLPAGVDTTAFHKTTNAEISGLANSKTLLVGTDYLLIEDSAGSTFDKKKVLFSNVVASHHQSQYNNTLVTASSTQQGNLTDIAVQMAGANTFTPTVSGNYLLHWYAEFGESNNNRMARGAITQSDAIGGTVNLVGSVSAPTKIWTGSTASATNFFSWSGIIQIALTAGRAYTFIMYFGADNNGGGNTAYLNAPRLFIRRVN